MQDFFGFSLKISEAGGLIPEKRQSRLELRTRPKINQTAVSVTATVEMLDSDPIRIVHLDGKEPLLQLKSRITQDML